MTAIFSFLASLPGRVIRFAGGVALILVGLLILNGFVGWIVAAIGLVPLAAGFFDRCVFAPLVGLPFQGDRLRSATKRN